MRLLHVIALLFVTSSSIFAQSIHQDQLNHYNSLGNASASYYESIPNNALTSYQKSDCNLNKVVYGWHPYWVGNAYQNYQWDLLSHFSFFSYEVNPSTGEPNSTHGWATSAAVDAALASGNTKVTLCVTLFGSHATFFGSATAQQTLIDNLISMVSSRGAHGVNIDFEGIPSSQTTNFANFMVDLANQMHTAIPGSEVSTVLYAVDWNNVFDFSIMEPAVDHYIVMGYGYYYTGSSTAGPTDPLYHFGSSYNFTLSRTITYYLDAGCPSEKLIMGLPFYGYEWPTTSTSIPSSTAGSGNARTYAYVRNNTSGNYSTGNHNYDDDSFTDVYVFNSSGQTRQCFITMEGGFEERLKHINRTGIGGIGIWALGYDNGYTDLWQAMENQLTDCQIDPCSGSIFDFGGPTKNYYSKEDYTWTVQPPNTSSLTVTFDEFDVEANYDYLYIYDGDTDAAAQIAGSPFTGTTSPGTFTTSTGAVTFRFTSDGATVTPGFHATYSCNADNNIPTTAISSPGTWKTADFNVNYTDADNEGISDRYSCVTNISFGYESGMDTLGYYFSDFSMGDMGTWSPTTGSWNVTSQKFVQSDESLTNAASTAYLNQSNAGKVVYQWKGKIEGAGSNRRAGLHFFATDGTATNGGDSYLVYWRTDQDKCQIYRCSGNSINLMTDDVVSVSAGAEYDFKIVYDPSTGEISAYLNDVLSSSWTDPSPLQNGNAMILRAGNCKYTINDLKVFKERDAIQTITVGEYGSEIYAQNDGVNNQAASIYSLVKDVNGNFSTVVSELLNIDYTAPTVLSINDGLSIDINEFVTPNELSFNWTGGEDLNSDAPTVNFAIGTSPGATDVVNWTTTQNDGAHTETGLSLINNQWYYVSLEVENGAGLTSIIATTDGQQLVNASTPPIANYHPNTLTICEGDSILLINTSTDGTSYTWSTNNGALSSTSSTDTYLIPFASGTYSVTLTANNAAGSNQMVQDLNVYVEEGPIASGYTDTDLTGLPNAIVQFTNTSTNATEYYWDFGDGTNSTDESPWHQFTSTGVFEVQMIAMNPGCTSDTTYFTVTVGHLSIDGKQLIDVTLYPNPFTNQLRIESPLFLNQILIVDIQGKELVKMNNIQKIELSTESFASGVYFVHLQRDGEKRTVKLIKQ